MKLSRKLIPAIAMLMVSLIMMTTASFAWFAMITNVTAQGMQVQAVTSKNLVISNESSMGSYAASADSKITDLQTLTPASTKDMENFFYISDSTGVDYTSGEPGVGSVVSAVSGTSIKNDTNSVDGSVYAVKTGFHIKVDGTSGQTMSNLSVASVKVTKAGGDVTTNKEISKALRVGVVCGVNKFIYAPVSGATVTYKPFAKAGTIDTIAGDVYKATGPTELNPDPITVKTTASSEVLATQVDTTGTSVFVYIWYEGQDENCTSGNSVNIEQLDVKIVFTAAA